MQHRKLVSGLLLVALLLAGWAVPGSSAPVALASSPEEAWAKVESLVLEELAADGQTDFFIWLVEKADLSPAYQLETKLEKGQFVFNALVETAERTQKDMRRYLDAQGVSYEPFYIANKILVQGGDQTLLLNVATRPDVERITANHHYELQEPFVTPTPPKVTAVEPNITFIKADQVWAMDVTGQGTVMAGNDTGLDETHPTIARHYRGCLNPPTCSNWDHNYNWWDATGTYPTNPMDGHGHGTHTTGTMVGDDGGANQIGVAPGAQTIHCKNMTNSGSGNDTTFTTCFQWDLAPWDLSGANPNPAMAPDAINNSWGYGGGNQNQFRDEILALHAAGILVEVSAGNEGPSCATLRSPGDYQEVLTTGSVDHIGQTFPGIITTGTWSTSRGPSDLDGNYFPDIMAPGNGIRSALPGNSYSSWGGTSMAGPHATALVGLMWSACPNLVGRVEDTIQIIRDTAAPLTGQNGSNCGGNYTVGPNNDWGMGTINTLAAVQMAIAQCAGIGHLDGYVRDAVTTAPLQDATVTAEWEAGGLWQASASASGYYTLTLPNGTYTVTGAFFGYDSVTVTSVEVITDQVTTQDLYLTPLPQYVISGTVTETGTGIPLLAEVEVVDTPLAPAWTDPGTGFYAIAVPQGTYTFRVTAAQHQPAERVVVADHNQTQDFELGPLPCILLVDDDNNSPDVQPYFTPALDNLGYDYDVFDVGGGSGNGPDLAGLEGYSIVIWFSGDKWGGSSAGPNGTDEANLAAYLDGGGTLFLSSQDYLFDFSLTPFGQDYLGISSFSNDSGNATTKYGVAGDPVGDGLGPYPLTYPAGFDDYGDIVNAAAGASVAFRSAAGGGNNLDVDKDGGAWKTVFFGTDWVPIYNNNAANGREVLQRIVDWFGGCECYPASDASFGWQPQTPIAGEDVTFTGTAAGSAPFLFEWDLGDGNTDTGPQIVHAFTTPGDYTVTMTATNACGFDVASDLVTVLPALCEPVQILDVVTATAGCVVTFSAELAGDPPFVYDWDFPLGSSAEPEPVVDFGVSGTYPYTLTVTNCDGQNVDTLAGQVTVACCEPVAEADFTWTPITPTVGQEVVFTGTATGSLPIAFAWNFGDGNGGTGQAASHTYTAAGAHTVVMTATNCAEAWMTATHTVVVEEMPVCTAVTGVELTLVTTGTLYPDEEVAFSAALSPDDLTMPYSYTISAGPVMTSTANPLAFTLTFTLPGTHTVEIAVWNCAMTAPVTAALPVVISAPPATKFYIYLPIIAKH